VALVVLLLRTDQVPKEYGFANLDANAEYVYLFQSVAFENEQERPRGFAKWNDWRQHHTLFEGEPPHPPIVVEVPDARGSAPAPQ
jgi:hypothetical protein